MKIKDILAIIEQNEEYKRRIEQYKYFPETQNLKDVLEHNYKKWLEMDIKEYKTNEVEDKKNM